MKSIELFAGAGGLGMGLHEAGFVPISIVEWNRYCCDTLRENQARGSSDVKRWPAPFQGDVRNVDFTCYQDRIDLVSGGPPCQPFSLGGKHQAHIDLRDMFPEAIRAVRQARPRAFVFENVKGLTRAAFRNYFEYIRLQMEHPEIVAREGEDWSSHLARLERHHTKGRREGLHYRVVARVLNAANYGVPQRRERVLFVGFRDDLRIEWSFPDETHSRNALIWNQARGDYWDRHGVASGAPGMPTAMAYELADSQARIEGLERLIDEIASQREKLERERDDWKDAAQREGEASRELRHLLKQSQDLALPAQVSPQARTEPLEVTHGPQRPADAPRATESGVSAWERLRRLLAGR